MPHLPAGMIDGLEKLLSSKFFEVEVISTVYINPEILKVTFRADLTKIEFHIGWAVMLRTGPKDLRHYTLSSFDRDTGHFDILFHIHGNGPGSDLALDLKVQERLKMAVPGGKKMLVLESRRHFFFGDETSLGLIQIFIKAVEEKRSQYRGVLELNSQNLDLAENLDLDLKTVLRTPEAPAARAIGYLNELKARTNFLDEDCVFYLTGNVASVHAFRDNVKRLGVSSKNIKLQGYWAEGIIGL